MSKTPTKRGAATRRAARRLATCRGPFLKIDGCWFHVEVLAPDPEVASKAVRVTKLSGVTYDCHRDEHGVHCTCEDGTYRRENMAEPCKHCRALIEERLL